MTLQNKEKVWLLSEKNLSDTMTAFYNAIIGLGENTKILQTDSPWDIDPNEFEGSDHTKDGMDKICGFLELIKNFTKDEATFREQFFDPFKIIAKMLDGFRDPSNSRRTADLEGWIFSISRPTRTSQYSSESKKTVSMVIPELQTVMSASISEESVEKTSSKYFQFTKYQPIGLVNRMHPVNGSSISKIDRDVLLLEFNFLFTSFNDIKLIGSSIEMENFCEVESIQSEVKQHMGFPFVSFAKVIDVQGSLLLEGIDKQEMISFVIPNNYYENAKMKDPKKLIGKYVRFFGVKWYNPSKKSESNREPEVFLMQEEENVDRLKLEDVIGMIRLRSKMSEMEIRKHLGEEIITDDCIEVKNNSAYFRYSGSDDPICAKFIETVSAIRNLREKFKTSSPRVIQEQLIDPKKLDKNFCISVVKKYRLLYEILVDHQMQMDQHGKYDRDLTISRSTYPEEIVKRKIWQLKFLKIFEFNKHDEKITNVGKKVLEQCMKDNMDALPSKSQSMIEIEKIQTNGIPPSVLLKYLEEGNLEGFSPAILEGKKTKMFWTVGGKISGINETKIIEYQNKRNAVLDVMRSVRNSVTSQWISEELAGKGIKIGNFVVNLLLLESEETVEQDGDSWKYPIHVRIYDLFQFFPDKKFNLDSICSKLVIPKLESEKIKKYLKDFENTGKVFSINDEWTSTKNIDKKITSIANKEIRVNVLRILNKVNDVSIKNNSVKDRYQTGSLTRQIDHGIVIDEIEKIFLNSGFLKMIEKLRMDSKQMIQNEIRAMIRDGIIIESDMMLSKKD